LRYRKLQLSHAAATDRYRPVELAKIFISGSLGDDTMIFAPIPNLIFSRDMGIAINNHILLNMPAKKARARETLLMRYIFFNHPMFEAYRDNVYRDSGKQTALFTPRRVMWRRKPLWRAAM
jgi:arginine deiminase